MAKWFVIESRGDSNLWTYEIRSEGKTIAHNSGFKTKKLAESEAEPILQELRLGKRISRDISLVDLYQEWLELKILPSSRSEETKEKNIFSVKTQLKDYLEIKNSNQGIRYCSCIAQMKCMLPY